MRITSLLSRQKVIKYLIGFLIWDNNEKPHKSRFSSQKMNFTYVIFLDKGEPPRTGTATVRLYTLNKNDEPPKFSQQVYFICHVACIININ